MIITPIFLLNNISNILNLVKNISPEWSAIIVSILLGLAGIFDVGLWFFKPKLKVSITLAPPDCHKIPLTNSTLNKRYDVYYLRFKISNTGNKEAKDVQVMMAELSRFQGTYYQKLKSFLPLNLIWAHIHTISMQTIPTKVFQYCDFGYLTTGIGKDFLTNLYRLDDNTNVILKTDTVAEPNTGSHIIFPGQYLLTIYISANNAKTIKKTFEIILKDKWHESEEIMFSEIIRIQEYK